MEFVVPEAKLVGYLLTNPKKSGFFLSFRYSPENWTRLRDDLLDIANHFPPILRRNTPHGDEYEVVGDVEAPNGRTIKIRTGWMIRPNEPATMYFVTAYPA
jgi:hypothetical protein